MITEFRDGHAFLSNMYECSIVYDLLEYPSVENAFQAMKSDNYDIHCKIAQMTPKDAKAYGRRVKLPEDWGRTKVSWMRDILHSKFKQNPDLAEKLVATGNQVLVENNTWHDQFWGNCICDKHKNTSGKNALGILLMAERLFYEAG